AAGRVLWVVGGDAGLKVAPAVGEESLERVLWLTVSVPKLAMPPSRPAESPDRVLWLTVSVPALKMPPPWSLTPLVMVRPDSVTAAELLVMSKTRLALLPLTCTGLAAGLSMSRLLLMASSPLVSVMVWPWTRPSKRILSPLAAAAMVALSDRAPLAGGFRTASVVSKARPRGPSCGGWMRCG